MNIVEATEIGSYLKENARKTLSFEEIKAKFPKYRDSEIKNALDCLERTLVISNFGKLGFRYNSAKWDK